MQLELSKAAKLPKRRKKRPEVPANVSAAIRDYDKAYRYLFKKPAVIQYDKAFAFIRINGGDGVGVKRLKQLTAQLRERARDLT
jgi:hypothetical protein